MRGRRVRVAGRVQGVGFRPFVWRLARGIGLTGHVRNDASGVVAEVWGMTSEIEGFLERLRAEAPPLARIGSISWDALDGPAACAPFRIAASGEGPVSAAVMPDVATCKDCLSELFDRADRRYHYPFINCTNCGPRLSIVEGIPYDRDRTTMAGFVLCNACRAEYDDPSNRRFHAQPIACPDCGPRLWLEDRNGPVACDDVLSEVRRRLNAGEIVAIKGIGGFQLACDATSPATVAALRDRKRRPEKPLALMARDLAQVRRYCTVTDAEAAALCSPSAPIVLLEAGHEAITGIAPGLNRLGMMLPNTPLHHLLMAGLDQPIVLTSGNLSSAPQVTGNAEARRDLARIAAAWLMHDRDIATRLDDSVLRVDLSAPVLLRRARGHAPDPVALPDAFAAAPPVLAMGGDLKSAFCLLREGIATLSPQLGDLGNAQVFSDFRRQISRFRDLYRVDSDVIAVDAHPDYLSARWGRMLAAETGARLVAVQHHHAHFAACLAENRIPPGDDRSVGVILDGAGAGPDGTVWGGEILLGGYRDAARVGHFPAVPMPGGEQAARQPWRNTVAQLIAAFGDGWRDEIRGTELARRFDNAPARTVETMIRSGINAPLSSSTGRLFDAVAGALGFDGRQSYEGQAAMQLECLATGHLPQAAPYEVPLCRRERAFVASWAMMWRAIVNDIRGQVEPGLIAARFHQTLVVTVSRMARCGAEEASVSRVALSGGAMQNRHLREGLIADLRRHGLDTLVHALLPSNDAGLSAGQASIVASRFLATG